MRKYYITSDKIGEFVARMYAAGVEVSSEPQNNQLVVKRPGECHEWVHVFDKGSFDELCTAFLPPMNNVSSTIE